MKEGFKVVLIVSQWDGEILSMDTLRSLALGTRHLPLWELDLIMSCTDNLRGGCCATLRQVCCALTAHRWFSGQMAL